MQTIVNLAKVLSSAFVNGERVSDETHRIIRILKEDRADWLSEVVQTAHGDMGPDDWRYEMIENVVDAIANLEDDADDGDIQDAVQDIEPSIYTADLTRWLASRADRYAYCDQAQENYGHAAGIIETIQRGQLHEYQEIAGLLIDALQRVADEMNEDSEDEEAA